MDAGPARRSAGWPLEGSAATFTAPPRRLPMGAGAALGGQPGTSWGGFSPEPGKGGRGASGLAPSVLAPPPVSFRARGAAAPPPTPVSPTALPASPSKAGPVASLARLGAGRFGGTAGRAREEIPSGRLRHRAREGGGTLTASPRQRAASRVTPPKCKTSRPSWRPLNPLVAWGGGGGGGSAWGGGAVFRGSGLGRAGRGGTWGPRGPRARGRGRETMAASPEVFGVPSVS